MITAREGDRKGTKRERGMGERRELGREIEREGRSLPTKPNQKRERERKNREKEREREWRAFNEFFCLQTHLLTSLVTAEYN